MKANRPISKLRSTLYLLLDLFLHYFVEKVTPKGTHTKLRFYHRQPLWLTHDEATILPNTRRQSAPKEEPYIVQLVDPKAKAKRSTRRVGYNWLAADLASGQALVHIDQDGRFEVSMPKGLKKGSGRSAYGCNQSVIDFEDYDWVACGKAPFVMSGWGHIDDAYFVDCKIHDKVNH